MDTDLLSTIKLSKAGGETIDSYQQFGFATGRIPFLSNIETKELATEDLPGEDGERVFFPDQMFLKPYDVTIEFKYCGYLNSIYSSYSGFRDFLLGRGGGGTRMTLYCPWQDITLEGVWIKSMEGMKFNRLDDEEFFTMEVTFHVSRPN